MTKHALIFKAGLALMLITCLITVYIPQSIYFAQREYFADYFINLIKPSVFVGLLIAGVVLLVLSLLPGKALKFFAALLLVLGLTLWIYVDYFSVSYGVLDGSALNFSHFDQREYIELIVLGVLAILTLLFHRFVLKQLPFLAMLVLVGLLAVTSVNIFQEPQDKELVESVDEEFFNYSADKNVILIVLDTFGSKYFQQIIDLNPEVTEGYQGFVSYTDAISNYPATKGSVPSLLMGEMIPEGVKHRKYLEDYLAPKGLPKVFSNNGYVVSVISVYRWFSDIYPERYMYQPQISQKNLTAFYGTQLLDFSLFRVTPHIFKPVIYNGGTWLLSKKVAVETEVPNTFPERGAALMEMMTTNAMIDSESRDPRFKMIHVTIPHPQYVYSQDCSKTKSNMGLPITYLMSQQSKCALKILDDLLDKYKAMGIYDNSVIVVTSDHGSRVMGDRSLTGFPSYFEMNSSGIMFMIKGMNQTSAFKQVDTPFSLMKLKGALQNEELHTSKYDYLVDGERLFYAFRNNHKAAKGYMQDAPIFNVGKNFSQPSSWQLKRFAANDCQTQDLPLMMTFNDVEREGYCSLYGFDEPDDNAKGTWTQSVDSRLVLNISDEFKKTNQVRTLKITFKSKIIAPQSVLGLEVIMNGEELGRIQINNPESQELEFEFRASLLKKNDFDVLQLNLPTVRSDEEMGLSNNRKKLGLLVEAIELN